MSDLDPLDRQKTDEPRFVLLARDPLSDGLVALWAALRGRHLHKINDIVKNLAVTAGGLPYRPDADPAHVISAQQVSNAMMIWRAKNTPKAPTNTRGVDLETHECLHKWCIRAITVTNNGSFTTSEAELECTICGAVRPQ